MNLTGIFDTHAHYDDAAFDADRDVLLASLKDNGVSSVINCGVDLTTSRTTLDLAHRYDYIYAAVGFHPEDCADVTDADFDAMRMLYDDPKVIAVGEIGLDYYWDTVPKDVQLAVFERRDSGERAGPACHHPRPRGARRHACPAAKTPSKRRFTLLLRLC